MANLVDYYNTVKPIIIDALENRFNPLPRPSLERVINIKKVINSSELVKVRTPLIKTIETKIQNDWHHLEKSPVQLLPTPFIRVNDSVSPKEWQLLSVSPPPIVSNKSKK